MSNTIELPPSLTRSWIEKDGKRFISKSTVLPQVLDFGQTINIDSAGIAFVLLLGRQAEKNGNKIVLKNISDTIRASIEKSCVSTSSEMEPVSRDSFFVKLGDRGIAFYTTVISALSMLSEILYQSSFGLLKRRDFRKGVFEQQMFLMGYNALGIVALLSFLIGMVLALQAALQLQRFGAGIYIAPMMTISMIKELGPLLTAIILTGRNGSAITAEIATMVVGEEIDALRTMDINPVQYIVTPKVVALSITMPVLSLFATTVGIVAGYLIAVLYFGIAPKLMLTEMMKHVHLHDVIANIVKSVVFSWIIVWIGAYHGFKVQGGAEAVGQETTKSVVNGIFVVILADAIFSFVF